jgi:hypothetical protein
VIEEPPSGGSFDCDRVSAIEAADFPLDGPGEGFSGLSPSEPDR